MLILMHEISIMQDTMQLAIEHLQKSGGSEIHSIRIRVGLLSGVVPEALEFAFDSLKADTPAANATLEFEKMPGLFCCQNCGKDEWLDCMEFQCSGCGGLLVLREGGADLELTQMKIS